VEADVTKAQLGPAAMELALPVGAQGGGA
jgi:hypothetical protein